MSTTVLLVNSRSKVSGGLRASLEMAGFLVLAVAQDEDDLEAMVDRYAPDAVVIDAESPARDTLEGLAMLHQRHPRPMIMLSEHVEHELIREASRAGVSVYAVEGISPRTLSSLVQTAIVQFDDQQRLHAQLERMQTELDDMRLVSRAKRELMRHRSLTETEAHRFLQQTAMRNRQRLGEAAQTVLDVFGVGTPRA